MIRRIRDDRGQSLVEFALCSVMLILLLVGVVDTAWMVIVCTTVSNVARTGVRIAMVHGSASAASTSFLNGITVAAPVYSCANPGCQVSVTASYSYNPLTTYLPSITLSSTSEGVVTF